MSFVENSKSLGRNLCPSCGVRVAHLRRIILGSWPMTCRSCGALLVNEKPVLLQVVEAFVFQGLALVGAIALIVFGWRALVAGGVLVWFLSCLGEAFGQVRLTSREEISGRRRTALMAVAILIALVVLAGVVESFA